MQKITEKWSVKDSAELYRIREWGAGYFDISESGDVVVTPFLNDKKVSVSLLDVISGIKVRGYDMPVLLRIEDILDSQIIQLHESFRAAIAGLGYKGEFKGVFPIKVNPKKAVIDAITCIGKEYHHGLEVGSKTELIAALSFLKDKEACLICNGYKDREFIELGLFACKMGYKCFFVLEMPSELDLIFKCSRTLDIRPLLGVRLKISTKGGGHWTDSGGDNSLFGLTVFQIVEVFERLKEAGMQDCLQMLHYHLGSQIPNIRDIRSSIQEASRVYAGLVKEGAVMGYFDLGGGFAVDYDGSNTSDTNSRNYNFDEYCVDIIEAVMEVLDHEEISHPTIITESGRVTVAYYSVLLFNIFDTSNVDQISLPDKLEKETPDVIMNMMEALETLNMENIQECYNDALYYREQVLQLFKTGDLSLKQRALADIIFWCILCGIGDYLKKLADIPKSLKDIDIALCDTYYGNFSIFQSLPDFWAIDHIFPVMPVHRLNEKPSKNGIIADITCDCDGKIDRFIDRHGVSKKLKLHEVLKNQDYYIGVFLVGAYQETLGDFHNLLGNTNVMSIRVYKNGTYSFVQETEGGSVADILSYVDYTPKKMVKRFRLIAEQAVLENLISPEQRRKITMIYEQCLRGYTYFNDKDEKI